MITSRQILAATVLMAVAGLSQAQTPMSPPSAAAQSNDPMIQKRQADADAKANYKMEKKAAKKDYKNTKKTAKADMKNEKAMSAEERNEKLKADPMVKPAP